MAKKKTNKMYHLYVDPNTIEGKWWSQQNNRRLSMHTLITVINRLFPKGGDINDNLIDAQLNQSSIFNSANQQPVAPTNHVSKSEPNIESQPASKPQLTVEQTPITQPIAKQEPKPNASDKPDVKAALFSNDNTASAPKPKKSHEKPSNKDYRNLY